MDKQAKSELPQSLGSARRRGLDAGHKCYEGKTHEANPYPCATAKWNAWQDAFFVDAKLQRSCDCGKHWETIKEDILYLTKEDRAAFSSQKIDKDGVVWFRLLVKPY